MDHCDLIAELPAIEQLPVVKRLELARKRRAYQLTKCKESEKKENGPLRPRKRLLRFQPTIALLEAASRGDVDEVRELLEAGVDPDSRNEDGLTPLHQCCIDNSEEVLLLLLAYGANVNARDTELWSPLHAAACCGHMNICKHLVNHGADLLAVNADSNMAYDICDDDLTLDFLESEMAIRGVTQEQIDALRANNERQMLLDLQRLQRDGATLEFIDNQGATPLHIASANGYGSVAQFLLDCGVGVDPRDNDSWQPVHAAACWAQPLLLEMLVAYGADITAQTDGGETALDLCEEPEVRDIIVDLCRRQKEQKLRFSRDSHRLSKRKKPSSKFESPQYASTTSSFESHSSSSRAIRRLSLRDKSGATLARLEARQEALLRSRSLDDDSSLVNDSNVPNQIHDAGGDYDISMETDSERDENDDEVSAGFRRGAASQPRVHRNGQQDGPIVVRHPGRAGQKQLLHDPSLDYAVAPADDATLQRPCSEPPNFASAISAADWIKRLKQEELALPPATNGKSSSHVTSPALANSSPASSRGGCHSNASSPLATGKASVSSNDTATKPPARGTPNTTRPANHARNLNNLTTTVSTDSCDEDEPSCGTSIAGVQVLLVEQKPSPILPSKNITKTPQAVVSNNEETPASASNNRINVNNISITPSNSFAVSSKSVDQPVASVAQNTSSTEAQVKNTPGASLQSGPEGTPPVAKSVPVYRIAGSARNTGSVQPPTEFVPESNSRRPSADQKTPAQLRSSANKLPLQRSLDSPVKTPSSQPDPSSHQQSHHPASSSSAADAGHSYRLGTTLPSSATVQQSSGQKPSGKNHHLKAPSGSSHQHHKEQNSVGAATSARNHNSRSDKVVANPTFVVGSSRLELTGRERGIDVGDFEAAGDTGRFSSPVARFRAPEGEVVGGAHRRSSKIHDGGKCCVIL